MRTVLCYKMFCMNINFGSFDLSIILKNIFQTGMKTAFNFDAVLVYIYKPCLTIGQTSLELLSVNKLDWKGWTRVDIGSEREIMPVIEEVNVAWQEMEKKNELIL